MPWLKAAGMPAGIYFLTTFLHVQYEGIRVGRIGRGLTRMFPIVCGYLSGMAFLIQTGRPLKI